MDMSRDDFLKALISELETQSTIAGSSNGGFTAETDLTQVSKGPLFAHARDQSASDVFRKLCFDFPDVSTEQIARFRIALLEVSDTNRTSRSTAGSTKTSVSNSAGSKELKKAFHYHPKFLENVLELASREGSHTHAVVATESVARSMDGATVQVGSTEASTAATALLVDLTLKVPLQSILSSTLADTRRLFHSNDESKYNKTGYGVVSCTLDLLLFVKELVSQLPVSSLLTLSPKALTDENHLTTLSALIEVFNPLSYQEQNLPLLTGSVASVLRDLSSAGSVGDTTVSSMSFDRPLVHSLRCACLVVSQREDTSTSAEIQNTCQKILVVMRDIWTQLLNLCRDLIIHQPSLLSKLLPASISPLLLYSDKWNAGSAGNRFPSDSHCTFVFLISSISAQLCSDGVPSSSSSSSTHTDTSRSKTLSYQRAEARVFLQATLNQPKSSPALDTLVSICEDMVKYCASADKPRTGAVTSTGPSGSAWNAEESSMNIAALSVLLQVASIYLQPPVPQPLSSALQPLLASRLVAVTIRLWRNCSAALESLHTSAAPTVLISEENSDKNSRPDEMIHQSRILKQQFISALQEVSRWIIRSPEACVFVSKLHDFKAVYSTLSTSLQSLDASLSTSLASSSLPLTSTENALEIITSIPLILGLMLTTLENSLVLALQSTLRVVVAAVNHCVVSILALSTQPSSSEKLGAGTNAELESAVSNKRDPTDTTLKEAIKYVHKVLQSLFQTVGALETECTVNAAFATKLLSVKQPVDLSALLLSLCTDIDTSIHKLLQNVSSVSSFSITVQPVTVPAAAIPTTSAIPNADVMEEQFKSLDHHDTSNEGAKTVVKSPMAALTPLLHDTKRQIKSFKLILLSKVSSSDISYSVSQSNKTD